MIRHQTWTFRRTGFAALTACLLGAILTGSAHAASNGGAWLLEVPGARATALQAYTPLSDDVSAIVANPAGLGNIKSAQVLLSGRESVFDVRENYLGATLPGLGPGSLGVGWRNIGVGDSDDAPFRNVDANGNDLGPLSYGGNALDIAYGFEIMENLNAGAGIRIVLDHLEAIAYPADTDEEYVTGFGGLQLGVVGEVEDLFQYGIALRNLGGSLGEEGSIPVALDAGMAYTFGIKRSVTISAAFQKEFVDLAESTSTLRGGVEYRLSPISLRLGTSQSSDRTRMYAGFGVMLAPVQLDYAYQLVNRAPYRMTESPRHYVSLSYIY